LLLANLSTQAQGQITSTNSTQQAKLMQLRKMLDTLNNNSYPKVIPNKTQDTPNNSKYESLSELMKKITTPVIGSDPASLL
jgi:hypothetical protein